MIPPPGSVCDVSRLECPWCRQDLRPEVTPDVGVEILCGGCQKRSVVIKISRRLDNADGKILSTVILRGKEGG